MLNTFLAIHETEGIPMDIVVDHVGQAVFDVYGIDYGDDEPWDMTDSISVAIEQCYDIADQQTADAVERVAHINTELDVVNEIDSILNW